MTGRHRPQTGGIVAIVMGTLCGLLTNVVTQRNSVALAVALVAVVAIWLVLDIKLRAPTQPAGPVVTQLAQGGEISHSRLTASGDARITELASEQGAISDSSVMADGATVDRRAERGGSIADSHIHATAGEDAERDV